MTALPSRRRSSLAAPARARRRAGRRRRQPGPRRPPRSRRRPGIDEPLLANPPAADDGAPAEAPAIAGARCRHHDRCVRPRRRARADPRRRRLLGRPPRRPTRRHRVRRQARRVRRRRGAHDRRRHRLPPRRVRGRRRARGAAGLRAGARDARLDPRVPPPVPRGARPRARRSSPPHPGDPTALGVLGDASLELGDLAHGDRGVRRAPAVAADGSASRVRVGAARVRPGRSGRGDRRRRAAVAAATDEGLEGDALAFYDVTLGETLLATGDEAGARAAYEAALAVRPDLPAALVGLAKLDAFDGDLSTPRSRSSTRPSPRSRCPTRSPAGPTCETLRGEAGDAREGRGRPGDDRGDREARRRGRQRLRPRDCPSSCPTTGSTRPAPSASPQTSSRSAPTSTATTRSRGRCSTPATPPPPRRRCSRALAAGTKDARLWYHAGLIAAGQRAVGGGVDVPRPTRSRLGPALDPVARQRADGGPGDAPMRRRPPLGRRGAARRVLVVPLGAGRRARPPAGQLHDQPLRGHPRRAAPGPARRRHRRGRDPHVPGDAGLRPRRRRRRSRRPRRRRRGRAACDVRVRRACRSTVDGSAAPLRLTEAGLSFPPGNGGLSTMRLVCTFDAPLAAPLASRARRSRSATTSSRRASAGAR